LIDFFNKQTSKLAPYAPLFIRLAFGFHLIQYRYAEVFALTVASGNADWLRSMGMPFPYFMSWLNILAEFLGGLSFIIGFKVRIFAVALIINFVVALLLVHLNNPYKESFEAIQLLAVSSFFLFSGAGKLSLDQLIRQRTNA
jgi:putative oxidoreductase